MQTSWARHLIWKNKDNCHQRHPGIRNLGSAVRCAPLPENFRQNVWDYLNCVDFNCSSICSAIILDQLRFCILIWTTVDPELSLPIQNSKAETWCHSFHCHPATYFTWKLLELSKKEEASDCVPNASQGITEGQLNEKKLEAESLAWFPLPGLLTCQKISHWNQLRVLKKTLEI